MFEMWTSNIPFLLCANSGGIILIPFAASALVRQKRKFWAVALGLAGAAGALNVAIELVKQSNPSNNILYRDIGAIAVLACACPIVIGLFVRAFVRQIAATRIVVATAAVVAFMFATPFAVLITHCTSGDCL